MGAQVIGTSRSPDKLARAAALGLHVPVLSPARDFVEATMEATAGAGAAAALDLVGGAQFPRTLAALAERGRVVLVGLTAGAAAEVDLAVILRRRLRIEGTVLRPRSAVEKAAAVAGFAADVLPCSSAGVPARDSRAVLPFAAVARPTSHVGMPAISGSWWRRCREERGASESWPFRGVFRHQRGARTQSEVVR
jgi:NADPH:quinone reductase-like Zn-dependent oxidoreductase